MTLQFHFWAYIWRKLIKKDTRTPVFIAALLKITKTWKQPCPSADAWMKKMCYIHTGEYYSAIKKDEAMPFAAICMDLQIIIVSEVSQIKTNTIWYHLCEI